MIDTSYFNRKWWDDNGGRSNRRPTWWDESTRSGKVTRIYINASWFPTWREWEPEAQRALLAAEMALDPYTGVYERRGSSYPIASEPHYYLEKDLRYDSGYSVWVNCCCPNEQEFQRTVREAMEQIADGKRPLNEMRTASMGQNLPMLPVDSAEYQDPIHPAITALLEALK